MFIKAFAVCIALAAMAGHVRASWPTDPSVNTAVAVAPNGQLSFGVLRDGAGGGYVVWFDQRNGDFTHGEFYGQRVDANGDVAWGANGISLSPLLNAQGGGWTCSEDGAGGAVVAWFESGGTLRAQRVNGSGTRLWGSNGVIVTTSVSSGPGFSMCDDNAGGAIFTWTVGTEIFAQRIAADGTPQWQANGLQITLGAGVTGRSWAVADGAGGAIIAWTDFRSGLDLDVYSERINDNGVAQWNVSGAPVAATTSNEVLEPGVEGTGGRQFVAPDGLGGAFIAFVQPAGQGMPTQLFVQRLDSAGSAHWGSGGHSLVTSGLSIQDHPVLLADNSGGVFVAWEDTRSGSVQVFAQRLGPGGGNSWTTDGVRVAERGGSLPFIISDGGDGVVIGFAGTPEEDIFAQRMDHSGTELWGATGLPICTAPGIQWATLAVPGACGMIAAWRDARNDDADIYAQGVDSGGSLGCLTVSVDPGAAQDRGARLLSSFPNPGRPMTSISYSLGNRTHAILTVHDATGRLVKGLVDGVQSAGPHTVEWDGSDDLDLDVPSGVYWAVLESDVAPRQAYRMTLVR